MCMLMYPRNMIVRCLNTWICTHPAKLVHYNAHWSS